MRVYETSGAYMPYYLAPLDAKELLMLYGMMVRAEGRMLLTASYKHSEVRPMVDTLAVYQGVADDAYVALMHRVASISKTDEFIYTMPSRREWKDARRPGQE